MLRSILVGLDVSAHSESLTELAVRWAGRLRARIVGLGIVDEPGIRAIEPAWPVAGQPGKDPIMYVGYEGRMADVHREVDRLLADLRARGAEGGIESVTLTGVGSPAEIIEREAQVADVVLLPQRPRFRFTSHDHEADDTVRKVLKNAPRPIVIVPAKPVAPGPVVIAYDGSLQAARVLAAFEATGLAESGQVHVLCVAAPGNGGAERAGRAREFLGLHGIEADVEVLTSSGPPAPLLLERLKDLRAGLVVMGAYGKPVLREFVIGSLTRTILEQSAVPVMAYH